MIIRLFPLLPPSLPYPLSPIPYPLSPQEYMVRPPMPPVYFFAIDVTHAASSSGALAATCRAIRSCLDSLPGDERTRVRGCTEEVDASVCIANITVLIL